MARQLDKKSVSLFCGALAVLFAMVLVGFRNSLDAKLFYKGDDAGLFLALLGDSDRTAYIKTEILDFLFIFFYTSFAHRVLTKLLPNSPLRFFALVPGTLDLVETVTIFLILTSRPPEHLNWLGFVTFFKWTSGGMLILFWIYCLVRRRFGSFNSTV